MLIYRMHFTLWLNCLAFMQFVGPFDWERVSNTLIIFLLCILGILDLLESRTQYHH